MKKYELTEETKVVLGVTLHRIKALISIEKYNVKAGDLGGYVEKEDNLNQDGNAWVSGNAWVYGDARVYDDARVSGDASVSGKADVSGNAWVSGDARVYGNARVYDDASVSGDADVSGNERVCGKAEVYGDADYTTIKGFGTEFRTTTFFRCKDKLVRVKCGCFYGTIEEFRKQVNNTRSGKVAEEYLMIADLMEKHFEQD